MDLEQVVKLLALMESHDLDEVEIEQDDMRIRLKKGGSPAIAAPVIAAPVPVTAPLNNRNPAVNGRPSRDGRQEHRRGALPDGRNLLPRALARD